MYFRRVTAKEADSMTAETYTELQCSPNSHPAILAATQRAATTPEKPNLLQECTLKKHKINLPHFGTARHSMWNNL